MVKTATHAESGQAPDRGDLVWLNFDPQSGHEQAGKRPALVLSPRAYNAKVGLALFCPITSHVKGYPFEVALPANGKIKGVVLCDQVKNLDWRARQAKIIERAPPQAVAEVIRKLKALTG
jgi:mRNA interferase MazF